MDVIIKTVIDNRCHGFLIDLFGRLGGYFGVASKYIPQMIYDGLIRKEDIILSLFVKTAPQRQVKNFLITVKPLEIDVLKTGKEIVPYFVRFYLELKKDMLKNDLTLEKIDVNKTQEISTKQVKAKEETLTTKSKLLTQKEGDKPKIEEDVDFSQELHFDGGEGIF